MEDMNKAYAKTSLYKVYIKYILQYVLIDV